MPEKRPTPSDGRLRRGERTRAAILHAACSNATIEGLDGVSLGALASELHVSKSGVFAHFGSKEELQLATIEEARQRFIREVIRPADQESSPLARLWQLCILRLRHMRSAYPGGCFFGAANAEYDARHGPLHDRLAEIRRRWLERLCQAATDAALAKQLKSGFPPHALAQQLDALAVVASSDAAMFSDYSIFEVAAQTSLLILRNSSVEPDADLPSHAHVATTTT